MTEPPAQGQGATVEVIVNNTPAESQGNGLAEEAENEDTAERDKVDTPAESQGNGLAEEAANGDTAERAEVQTNILVLNNLFTELRKSVKIIS